MLDVQEKLLGERRDGERLMRRREKRWEQEIERGRGSSIRRGVSGLVRKVSQKVNSGKGELCKT